MTATRPCEGPCDAERPILNLAEEKEESDVEEDIDVSMRVRAVPEPLKLEKGQRMEVEYEGVWYDCDILEVGADGTTCTAKYDDGGDEELSGGYAGVTGYSYAVAPCTSGSCKHQDLDKLAAALEETPVSICVNAGTWNDYTGGVLTAAACGSMAADAQDHCVMATGFNTTAPKPYWIVRNSWASTWGEYGYIYLEMAENTCGLADDATIPDVKLDLSEEKAAEAAVGREAMYQQATRGSSQLAKPIVI